jgi:hypothetical protein
VQSRAGRGLGPVLGGHSHAGPAHLHGPQDGKLDPDGSAYYVADCEPVRLWMLDGAATTARRFIPTGRGVRGLYLSRDASDCSSPTAEKAVSAYSTPTPRRRSPSGAFPVAAAPDMGELTADGFQLWFSGRYDNVVCVPSTVGGAMMRNFR